MVFGLSVSRSPRQTGFCSDERGVKEHNRGSTLESQGVVENFVEVVEIKPFGGVGRGV